MDPIKLETLSANIDSEQKGKHKNLKDTAKAKLRRKCIALYSFFRKLGYPKCLPYIKRKSKCHAQQEGRL